MSNYDLVRDAIINKQIVIARYDGYLREMCPHVIGRSRRGQQQALFYQFAGGSSSGLGPVGSPTNWRCIPIAGLSDVQIVNGPWRTASKHTRPQTCVSAIDVEVTY